MLFLLFFSVGLWVTEAVPAFAVGLLIMGYLVFALGTPLIMPEPWNVEPYLNTWSSPVISILTIDRDCSANSPGDSSNPATMIICFNIDTLLETFG